MLEQPLLLVHAWTQATLPNGEPAWIRAVADGGGKRLGFVRFVGDPKGSWISWLRKVRLDVYETDDASHLFSLTRSWGVLHIWEVVDADDRHVGTAYSKTIVSSDGDRLGYLDRESAGQGRILDSIGQVLLRYVTKPGHGVELAFAQEGTANPFLRMLMLGSILALDAVPK